MISEIFLFISSIFAFSISSVVGGGASLILIPCLALHLPVSEIPSALVIGTFTSSLSRCFFLFQDIRWKVVFNFLPAALPAVFLGTWLLKYVDPLIISWVCSIFLLSNFFLLIGKKSIESNSTKQMSKAKVILIGFLAGLVSGITGAVGLIFNGFYLKSGLSKSEIVATRAANEILLHVVKLYLYFKLGLFSANSLSLGAVIAIAAIVSTCTIKAILPYFKEATFRKIGYSTMAFSGLFLFFNTSSTIIADKSPAVKLVSVENGVETKLKQLLRENFPT